MPAPHHDAVQSVPFSAVTQGASHTTQTHWKQTEFGDLESGPQAVPSAGAPSVPGLQTSHTLPPLLLDHFL